MKYLFFYLIVSGLILCILLSGCTSPRDKRGDWMENLSGRTYEPIDWWSRRSPWYRSYRTTEEIHEDWEKTYKKVIADLDKIIEDNTP
jgi:hypothetical protein